MNYLDPVFSIVGRLIIAGGGGALIAFLMLRAFGKGWLDSYFSAKATKLKAEQDTALAELKRVHDATLKDVQAVIDKDLHRARKLYHREFDVLGEAWMLAVILSARSAPQRQPGARDRSSRSARLRD